MSRARDLADGTFSGTVTADDILLSDADTPTLTLTDTTNTLSTFVQSGNSTAVIGTSTNHDLRFFTNNSEKARILSGGGITFNGDTAAANALDDYEEGTWTATAAGTSAIGNTTGYYQKIGDRCFFYWYSEALTMSSAVNAVIGGLPFNCASGSENYSAITAQHNTYAPNSTGGYVIVGSSSLDLVVTNQTYRDTTPSSGTKYVMISGHYKVA